MTEQPLEADAQAQANDESDGSYAQRMATYEEELARKRASSIEAGRRKGGAVGAAMAGAMMVMQEIYEGKTLEDAPIVSEAESDPDDLDKDGIKGVAAGKNFEIPPLERLDDRAD